MTRAYPITNVAPVFTIVELGSCQFILSII